MFEHPFMRPLRLQLNKVNEIAKRRLFDGGTAEEYHQKKAEKRLRQIWRARAVEFDRCGCAVCVCLAWQCSHGSWVYGVSFLSSGSTSTAPDFAPSGLQN